MLPRTTIYWHASHPLSVYNDFRSWRGTADNTYWEEVYFFRNEGFFFPRGGIWRNIAAFEESRLDYLGRLAGFQKPERWIEPRHYIFKLKILECYSRKSTEDRNRMRLIPTKCAVCLCSIPIECRWYTTEVLSLTHCEWFLVGNRLPGAAAAALYRKIRVWIRCERGRSFWKRRSNLPRRFRAPHPGHSSRWINGQYWYHWINKNPAVANVNRSMVVRAADAKQTRRDKRATGSAPK